MSEHFNGAKIALIRGGDLLAYLRDDKPTIPFTGMWDLPGGGREGDETPEQCVLREVHEEFALTIPESRIVWRRRYPAATHTTGYGYFFAAAISDAEIAAIRFGDEGQRWEMMSIADFLAHERAPAFLKERLSHFLDANVQMSERG